MQGVDEKSVCNIFIYQSGNTEAAKKGQSVVACLRNTHAAQHVADF